MRMSTVMLELMAKNIIDIPPLKVGEFLAARVLQIENEMLLLLVNNKTVLQSKLVADIELRPGQEIILQVKDIKEGRIELSVASGQRSDQNTVRSIPGEYNIKISQDSISIIQKLVENGLPVAAKNLEEIQRTIRHITYSLDNLALIEKHIMPTQLEIINTPLDEIVKWMVFVKEETDKVYVPTKRTIEQEKLIILMKELTGVAPEDIIKLRKFGLEISPYNLVLAKNFRENKGFLGILLKVLYGNGDREKTAENQWPLENSNLLQNEEGEIKLNSKTHISGNDTAEHAKAGIKPLNIARLLERVAGQEKANPELRAAAQLLAQKAVFLNKTLASQEYCIFPFLFDGQASECIIRSHRENGHNKGQQSDIIQLEIDIQLPHLGRIKTLVSASNKNIVCSFFVEEEDIGTLIEKNKNALSRSIEKAGFRVKEINCQKLTNTVQKMADKFLDLKV